MCCTNQCNALTSISGGDLVKVWNTANGGNRQASMTLLASYVASNLGNATCASLVVTPVAVALLPAAATAGMGYKCFVSDATATTFASVVAGGGSNKVPVYSDGTNWRIG